MRLLLDEQAVASGLQRMAENVRTRPGGVSDLVIVGVRRGGVAVMHELARRLEALEGRAFPLGTVDITLYRDDAATRLPNPRIGTSEIPGSIDGKRVLLVDDVSYTRRTTRAALDAILDYGRPRSIELAVLIDRSGAELPIQPDYSVAFFDDIGGDERVEVVADARGLRAVVQPANAPSILPGKPVGNP
jgi:pyrimidine operon attenuation protein/uracil phosphoribosyltransferase